MAPSESPPESDPLFLHSSLHHAPLQRANTSGPQQHRHTPLLQGTVTILPPGARKPLSPQQYRLPFMSLCSLHVIHHLLNAPKTLAQVHQACFFPRMAFCPGSLPLQTSGWPLLCQAELAPSGNVDDPLALASGKSCSTRNRVSGFAK